MERPSEQEVVVRAYSGSRGEEEPRAVMLEGFPLEVTAVLDRWREPDGRLFRVQLEDRRRVILRCREPDQTWWLVG